MKRVLTPERMDDPAVPRDELARALRFIRAVNKRLGGAAALTRELDRLVRTESPTEPITILDLATGSADIPVLVRRWADRAGVAVRITAVDLHDTTLDLAREHVDAELGQAASDADTGIELVKLDAKDAVDRFGPRSFDVVHAGMFLHHLSELDVLTVLRIMHRLARRLVVWNDLLRSRLAQLGIWALTLNQSEMIKHDARVSVRAGFTKREALDYARRVGLDAPIRCRALPWQGRFVLTSWKGPV